MTLRRKFALAFAAVAAIAIAAVVVISYDGIASLIKDDTEQTYRSLTEATINRVRSGTLTPGDFNELTNSRQVASQTLGPDGSVVARDPDRTPLPVTGADRELAAHHAAGNHVGQSFTLAGEEYRSMTVSLGAGRGAVQIAQRAAETRLLLRDLAQLMMIVGAVVFVLAGLAGALVAGRITRRLERLTGAAELVSASGRLDIPVPARGRDEVARLGTAFDSMLSRLAGAREDQRRLVQDAGHELRTPLTSLRTNVAVLRRFEQLPPEQRLRLIDDLASETGELSSLVEELVELAGHERIEEAAGPVDLAGLAREVAARLSRRTGREILVDAPAEIVVTGRARALARALSNLIDNAVKFDSAARGPIELVVRENRVRVRDRGPGLAPEDTNRVFDRFYRATQARAMPGSGLGLAIVREVAISHGGTVFAGNRAGGGAEIGFTLGEIR